MKSAIAIVALLLVATPAKADFCTTIRGYVATYGIGMVTSGALARGYTQKQINHVIRKCLRTKR